jgi:uncharacterized membrane protein YkoI
MRNKDVEQKIKNAVEHLTPDVLDNILSECGERQGSVYIIQPMKRKGRWVYAAYALAAALALVFGGLFAFDWISGRQVDAWVALDVNPSVELQVNKNDRVLAADAKNEDAVKILDHMDLTNTPIDVAVNALIGSMLKHGYIQESSNSILLSVESANGEKSAVLQRSLTESISRQLNRVNGAVISQNLTNDGELRTLAKEHQISYGKAALVQKILNENSHLLFADLAKLSINELNLLIGSKHIEAQGMEAQGSASDTAFIGEAKAKQTALEHAGLSEREIERLHIELDYDDGAMVYDVEFYHSVQEYEYEINAENGTIMGYDRENRSGGDRRESPGAAPQPQDKDDFIGETRAAEIAEKHSGVPRRAGMKVELDKEDGLYIYEVEFDADGKEYEYEINAATGDILSWECDF